MRDRVHGHRARRPDPARHRREPRGHAHPDRAALHELPARHRRRDARHELRVEPHRRRSGPCSSASASSWCSPPRRASRRTSSRSSASAPAGGSATRSSSRPRSPRSWARRRAASGSAIILYEAALGLGIAIGPLLGGLLGHLSWRGPFFGTAALMAVGVIAILVFLKDDGPADAASRPEPTRLSAPLRALAPARARRPRRRRPVLQHRLLRAARVLAVPARVRRDGPRPHVLRVGRRARDHVGLRRAAPDRTDAAHPRAVDRAAAPGRSTSPRPAS